MNTAPIGHNNPPSDMESILAGVRERSEPTLFNLRNLMNKAKDEFSGKTVDTPEQCNEVSDFVKDLRSTAKKVEALRVAEKDPYKTAGDAIHAYFKTILDSVDNMASKLMQGITDHKNEELRKKRVADAAAAAAAKKLADEQVQTAVNLDNAGMTAQADNSLSKAQANLNTAAKHEAAAVARPADVVRSRGEASVTSLRTTWKGVVLDMDTIDLEKLRPFLNQADVQKALNAYVKAGNKESITGSRIFEESTATIR